MEKPFLTLDSKQFLTGLSSGAHQGTVGIFYKADGITPLYDAGGTASPENGMLQSAPAPTDFSAGLVDTVFAGVSTSFSGTAELYMLGNAGHLYQKAAGATAVSDLRSATPIPFPANGITVWGVSGGGAGNTKLYYWQQGKIGTWDMTGTYLTGWNDSVYIITPGQNSTILKPVHQFVGNVYYGNGDVIGGIIDSGSGTASHSSNVLDFPNRDVVTGIADDGIYLTILTTSNASSTQNVFVKNKVYFWDTFSTSWTREFEIRDPIVWAIQKIGGAVYVFGQYGVYQVTFAGGVKKILSRFIGHTDVTHVSSGYGTSRAIIYNNDALMFATDTTIDTFGKLQPDVPSAYIKGMKVPSSVGTPTFISAELDAGRVFMATTSNKLYAYDFNNATHDSGNVAQTVYFSLPSKTSVQRVDVVFGEPLISGDALSVGIFRDEDTAATSFGTATFATDGAIRRKSLFKAVVCEDQMSLQITFTSGAPKIKRIEVYGESMTP